MLHNVPVARILGFLFLASVVLLGVMCWDGYRVAHGSLPADAHIRFAVFGIIVVLFTHTMTLFYFVGTGSRIKKVVRRFELPSEMVDRTRRMKARAFPWLTFTPLVTMAAFILGGGAHTRTFPSWTHSVPAVLALVMNVITAARTLGCISDNIVLIEEIDAALPETATGLD